jgi:ACS family glucarate transporter-like MFS transporter
MTKTTERPAERPTAVRWRVLGVLVVLSFVAYVLRTNLSVAGDDLMRDLGLTQIELGFVLAAFTWGYALFQFPGGLFGQRFGGRRALTWIALAWGVLTLATGLVPRSLAGGAAATIALLVVLRFLMGVAQAPVFPVLAGVVGAWFPKSAWALPNGLSSSGLTLGAAATGPLIAGLATALGWRLSFVVTAPLAFVAAALWWRQGRDRARDHPAVGREELELIEADRREEASVPGAWKRVVRDRNVLLLTLSYFCMNYVFYIFFNWFFVYLVQVRGFGALESGFLATLPWLAGAVGATAGGHWCDRLSKSRGIRLGCRVPCVASLVAVSALLWAGAAARDAASAVALLALSFGCTQLTEGAYWSATTSVAGRHAAAAAGVLNTGGNAVGGIGAILVPFLAERFGWVAALSTGSLFALAGAALWLLIRADEPLRARVELGSVHLSPRDRSTDPKGQVD